MKIIFTMGSAAIGGGTNVILEHASKMVELKNEVYIVTNNKVEPKDYAWHSKAHMLKWVTYEEIKNINFDVAIATWWRTLYELYRIKADKYLYFVQSIESKFYDNNEMGIKILADLTYMLDLRVITEATWIKEYLEREYNNDVILVKNGIRKDIFNLNSECYPKCSGLRVLVEGPIDVPFKNVPKTIELVKKSLADEIWLLTSSNIKEYDGVDRVFSKIPMKDCAKIYSSCDVIVKLSYVEGMFGPPLEMFHCGGTTIVYDVTGHDEYIENGKNGIVVTTNNEEEIINSINKLKEDQKYLSKLKNNAIKTANNWIDWDTSSKEFYEAVKILSKKSSPSQKDIETRSKKYMGIYIKYEEKNISLKRKLGDIARARLPHLYKLYRKIRKN